MPVARPGESTSALLMAFDGRTVFLRKELTAEIPIKKGRVYLVNIAGPTRFEPPQEKMNWTDYQAWFNRMRAEGYTDDPQLIAL